MKYIRIIPAILLAAFTAACNFGGTSTDYNPPVLVNTQPANYVPAAIGSGPGVVTVAQPAPVVLPAARNFVAESCGHLVQGTAQFQSCALTATNAALDAARPAKAPTPPPTAMQSARPSGVEPSGPLPQQLPPGTKPTTKK